VAADPLTRSTADAVLKEFYLPGIRSILNNQVFLLSQVETNSEDIEGRRAVLAINTGRNQGVGARAEMGTLPDAGHQGYNEERVPLKYNYGRIQLSGPVIRSMGSDRGSFTRAIQSETQGVTRDLRNDVNRQCYGGGVGTIAVLNSAASGNTATVTNATATQMRQLQVGMYIDIGTAANPTATASNRQITSVNTTAGTFVFNGAAVAITAADIVTRTGSGGTGASQKEITGLAAQIASSGILWNIDPASVPNWVSYVDANGGTNRAVTETMFIKAAQEVNVNSGEEINLWVTSAGVTRAYGALLTSLKRFNDPVQLRGGYAGLDLSNINQGNTGSNSVAMVFDKDCQANTAWGITTRRFQWYKMSDWEFMEEDGAVLSRVPNVDAYEGTLFLYSELATDGRNAHAKIADLTEV
jgi:hypothetical protein